MMYFTELQMRFPTSLVMTEKGENGTYALLAVGPVEQVVDAPEHLQRVVDVSAGSAVSSI